MEEDDCQMGSGESRFSLHIRENPGADFIAAFIVALIIVAFVYSFDKDIANELTNFAFFSLVAGVILQALALRRDKKIQVGRESCTSLMVPRPIIFALKAKLQIVS